MSKRPSTEPDHSPRTLSVWKAILIGWLVVNTPAVVIMLGVLLIGATIESGIWWVFLVIAFVLGWTWWSLAVLRWRRWALRHGAPADSLQRWAVITGLVWKKGSRFERTEFHVDE